MSYVRSWSRRPPSGEKRKRKASWCREEGRRSGVAGEQSPLFIYVLIQM